MQTLLTSLLLIYAVIRTASNRNTSTSKCAFDFDAAFEGNLSHRIAIGNELLKTCVKRLPACADIEVPEFMIFMKAVSSLLCNKHSVMYIKESWFRSCQLQQPSRDYATCVAAAFSYLPFPLAEKSSHRATLEKQKTVEDNKQPKSLVTLTASSEDQVETPLLISACNYNISITVLHIKRFCLGDKIAKLSKYLENMTADANDTIIMFVDAFDVLFQANSSQIIEKFLKTKARILFAAEHR